MIVNKTITRSPPTEEPLCRDYFIEERFDLSVCLPHLISFSDFHVGFFLLLPQDICLTLLPTSPMGVPCLHPSFFFLCSGPPSYLCSPRITEIISLMFFPHHSLLLSSLPSSPLMISFPGCLWCPMSHVRLRAGWCLVRGEEETATAGHTLMWPHAYICLSPSALSWWAAWWHHVTCVRWIQDQRAATKGYFLGIRNIILKPCFFI